MITKKEQKSTNQHDSKSSNNNTPTKSSIPSRSPLRSNQNQSGTNQQQQLISDALKQKNGNGSSNGNGNSIKKRKYDEISKDEEVKAPSARNIFGDIHMNSPLQKGFQSPKSQAQQNMINGGENINTNFKRRKVNAELETQEMMKRKANHVVSEGALFQYLDKIGNFTQGINVDDDILKEENKLNKMYSQKWILLDENQINKDQPIFTLPAQNLEEIPKAQEKDNVIHCNQIIFQRNQPDGHARVIWSIQNLDMLFNSSSQIYSPVFSLADQSSWRLIFTPWAYQEYPNNISTITIYAVPTPEELKKNSLKRRISYSFQVNSKADGGFNQYKNWSDYATFTDIEDAQFVLNRFYPYKPEFFMKYNLHYQLLITLYIQPLIYIEPESNVISIPGSNGIQTRSRKRGKAQQNLYNGLINEGTTCYLNSLLQTLFINRAFRRAIYQMPTNIDDFKSIPFCLQRIFYNLQTGKQAVRTFELLNAFGWNQREMNQQHDVNEFFLVLSETLENQMKGTPVSGTYGNLFEGVFENVISCLNVNYESSRKETFNCLQLSMKECNNIEDSIQRYVAIEELTGDNQYDAEKLGKQDAKKFIRFKKFPPVLQIQVNRFDYDPEQDQMTKINAQFKFGDQLDLDAVLPKEVNQSQQVLTPFSMEHHEVRNLYHLHSILIHRGTLGAGHYYAFIRPSLDEQWYEFNDSNVTPLIKSTALSIGSGGFESVFEHKEGKIFEKQRSNNTSAYMLVYIRDQDRDEILREIPIEEIPGHLQQRFDEENRLTQKLDQDQNLLEDCGSVYLVSFDIISQWYDSGIMQNQFDFYMGPKFHDNEEQRLKIQMNKKLKILDLLTLIRKKTKYMLKDIQLYRLRNPKGSGYEFKAIKKEDYNTDIFFRKHNKAMFYVCHSQDQSKPILVKYERDEQLKRRKKYEELIDFVKRRDLSRDYEQTYRERMDAIWRFINCVNSNDNSFVEDGTNEEGAMITDNEEKTENLANEGSHEIIPNTIQIDTDAKMNSPNQQQENDDESRLVIFKYFNPAAAEDKQLSILSQSLISEDLTLQQIYEIGQDIVNQRVEGENKKLKMYMEAPFQISNMELFMEQDRKYQSILDIPILSDIYVSCLLDGAIFIFCEDNGVVSHALDEFLYQKNNEVYLELIEKEPDSNKTVSSYDKIQMSYIMTMQQIIKKIVEEVEFQTGRRIDGGHIQLLNNNGNRVPWNNQPSIESLIQEENQIHFEVLQFHIKDLEGKLIVKVQHYHIDNTEGDLIVRLVEMNLNVWRLIKHLKEACLEQVDGGVPTKQYMVSLIDKNTKSLIRVLDLKEDLQSIDVEMKKHSMLFRINPVSLFELDSISNKESPPLILFCTPCDQYFQQFSNPFIVAVQNLDLKEVREAILRKMMQIKMVYNKNKGNRGNAQLVELTDDIKGTFILNYLEYKTSRRTTIYTSFSVKEPGKDDTMLDVKPGKANLDIAIEIQLDYSADEDQRSVAKGLKIYNNHESNNSHK